MTTESRSGVLTMPLFRTGLLGCISAIYKQHKCCITYHRASVNRSMRRLAWQSRSVLRQQRCMGAAASTVEVRRDASCLALAYP